MSEEADIRPVAHVDCRFEPREWSFLTENRTRIEDHWKRISADKPAMFNGRVLLVDQWSLSEGVFRARFFETDYAAFLAFLAFGTDEADAWNVFAMAALRGSDGPYLLGEMSAHTAHAGKIYFPAGTPDRDDIRGDVVDLAGSVLREVAEETGLTADEVTIGTDWTFVRLGRKIALMREVVSPLPATDLMVSVNRLLASDPQAELARLHLVSQAGHIDPTRMPPIQTAYLSAALGDRDQRTG